MHKTTSIKHWSIEDRPAEKLLTKGAQNLTDSELLSILIYNGTVEKNALELAKDLLSAVNHDIKKLAGLLVREIVKLNIKGVGPAKAITIAAAVEFGIRREMCIAKKEIVLSSKDIADYLRAKLQYKKHEVFVVMFLNRANKINHYETISEGGMTGTVADPRIILKKALENDAVSIVLCHNHPSGSLKPSRADEEQTQKIKEAARYFDIKVLDHIIVSDEGYYSFSDDGIL